MPQIPRGEPNIGPLVPKREPAEEDRLNLPRRRTIAVIVVALFVVIGVLLWTYRWRLSRTAAAIADPLVRAWVTQHVLETSDSVYHLTATTIKVDESHRRVLIDSIILVTDSAANRRLARPHPAMTLRFQRCAVTGIDLPQLASGAGLHALHAGCEEMSIVARTLVPPRPDSSHGSEPADTNFLRFQGKLDLPAVLPFISIDAIEFPHVHVELDLAGPNGRRSELSVDSLALGLDSVHVDPKEPASRHRPLFAHDITVRLDRFAGVTRTGAHASLEHLRANYEGGLLALDNVGYQPPAGHRADSLGFTELHARHIRMTGVDWRTLLLSGDIGVARLSLDTVYLRSEHPVAVHGAPPPPKTSRVLEQSIRATGRALRVDSLSIKPLRIVEASVPRRDSVITTLRQVAVGHLDANRDEPSWNSPLPLGGLTIAVEGMQRQAERSTTVASRIRVDAVARKIELDSLRSGPEGDDSAWQRINPYRKARLSVKMMRLEARGIDLPAFVRRGQLRARAIEARGFTIDVLKDKNKPEDPAPNVIRRTPQRVLRDAGVIIQIDTLIGSGLVTYRERDAGAQTPGILSFGGIQLRGYNFSTDPARMTAAHPFRLIGDAKLMGAAAMHVEWNVPLLSRDFALQWKGTLGPMDPKAMNAFLPDAVGMRFNGGQFLGAEWEASVSNGLARGKIAPRWHDLSIELPGVARGDSGIFGGIARGVAKLAANTFGIRSDNDSTGGHQPVDGSINHQWVNVETLPQFTWFQLRDPLLLLLKK